MLFIAQPSQVLIAIAITVIAIKHYALTFYGAIDIDIQDTTSTFLFQVFKI